MDSAKGQVRFRNLYNFNGIDGMVLEIKVGGGPFQDILSAGGNFEEGGYNGKIRTGFSNPLEGRAAWIGLSDGTPGFPAYRDTVVNLPPGAAGQTVQLRWVVVIIFCDSAGSAARSAFRRSGSSSPKMSSSISTGGVAK